MSNTSVPKTKEEEAILGSKEEDGEQQHTVVDLSSYLEPHDSASPVMTFAIEMHQRNTEDNPVRESTNTVPVLVRRVDSEELLPRPFKSTKQLLCVSYLSLLCCCCFAAYAVKHAFEAMEKRNAGVYTTAVEEAKRSCCCLKLALVFGVISWMIGVVFLALFFSGVPL